MKNPSFTSSSSPSQLLQMASMLYGYFLSYIPAVVELAREQFYSHATITSNPTERGVQEIDGSHELYGLHVCFSYDF